MDGRQGFAYIAPMPAEQGGRIEQFQRMAEADPNNELGHFSLGKAYLEAGRLKEATVSLSRALALNPTLSKAYQFLGEAWQKIGDRTKAVDVLSRGTQVADGQGDRMPRDQMARMLKELGEPVPVFASADSASTAVFTGQEGAAGFRCSRCGRPDGKLEKSPFKGPLGEKIAANVCRTCWREWIPMGTKVINELSLVLSNPESQVTYDQYMVEFLQLEDR